MTNNLHPDNPVEGYYRRRFIRGGPWIGIHIAKHCRCTIGGGDDGNIHPWSPSCDRFPPLTALLSTGILEDAERHFYYCFGHQITEAEFKRLAGLNDWAEKHSPDDPYANEKKVMDTFKIKPLF